ncbi:YecA family protein [Budvicia diplopodorum]|uniref:YecA/YgfB family protein n=1 Tax=Budvicia diplopodorum TaxID=1119056 RepID=UPI001358654E|nr:YecA family protein [Budvicia diplopodorum]
MMTENPLPSYLSLHTALVQNSVGMTAAEMHGLISGMVCGGSHDSSWTVLLHDLTNEGIAFSQTLAVPVQQLYEQTKRALEEDGFSFQMLLPDDNAPLFERVDALSGWVNHFLLGLGVLQPKLAQVKDEVGEAIDDLRNIGQLGYDEEEDPEELEQSLEEVSEYVRMAAMLCHSEFSPLNATAPENVKPTLH